MLNMAFNPANGLRDTVQFIDTPTDPRDDVQDVLDQIRDYVNDDLFKFMLMFGG